MPRIIVLQEFSFGTPRVEVSLAGRYTDLGHQAIDRLRAACMASLLQLPQLIEDQQVQDSGDSSSQSDQQAQRDSRTETASSRRDQDDITAGSNPATVRIENGSGSIQVTLTLQPSEVAQQLQQPRLSATLLQGLANTIAATVMNHADAIIQHTAPRNDAFVQMMRYSEASRSLDPSQHSQSGAFTGSSGSQR